MCAGIFSILEKLLTLIRPGRGRRTQLEDRVVGKFDDRAGVTLTVLRSLAAVEERRNPALGTAETEPSLIEESFKNKLLLFLNNDH